MNFYKITNQDEKHYGMQYKTGLNIDVLPFNPQGDCEKGGIYFSREDILAFLDYGPWIRKVTLPENEEVYENPDTLKKWKSHRVILGKRKKITTRIIQELIEAGANVHADNDHALRWASEYGHSEIVKILLSAGADVHANDDMALQWASENGHSEVVKILKKGACQGQFIFA